MKRMTRAAAEAFYLHHVNVPFTGNDCTLAFVAGVYGDGEVRRGNLPVARRWYRLAADAAVRAQAGLNLLYPRQFKDLRARQRRLGLSIARWYFQAGLHAEAQRWARRLEARLLYSEERLELAQLRRQLKRCRHPAYRRQVIQQLHQLGQSKNYTQALVVLQDHYHALTEPEYQQTALWIRNNLGLSTHASHSSGPVTEHAARGG